MRALIDTNILVDYLQGLPQAAKELSAYNQPAISVITWIEVMVGATSQSEPQVRSFLASFQQLDIDGHVADQAAQLRRTLRLKLPAAIIWATAQNHGLLLVTRNTRDFDPNLPGIRVPYVV